MRRTLGVALASVLFASTAFAEEIKPTNVAFADGAVEASLTGIAGDAAAGRKVFANRKQGNCLACHANSDLSEESFHGEVGPPMDGAADRWTEAELRGIVTNSKMMFEGTIMPAFYVESGYERPLEKFAGKSILTAQQVEDVIAYLMTLKEE
ncbi:MAG: sulfur oxidation c-type cytochrome SoxX [Rhodobacteraceae bacterium]|nr:sulfur oxidation c-type cytochrome SoxX [Paracoccaceae bacterium]